MINASRVLVATGHGLNCQVETMGAFEASGHSGEIAHIDDLIDDPSMLDRFDVLALPGGFSFGDHLGAGKALSNLLRQRLAEPFKRFMDRGDTKAIGICNGCQALVKSGLWHQDEDVAASVSLVSNHDGAYICRWEAVEIAGHAAVESPWLSARSARPFQLPIAHGEGRFVGEALAHAALTYAGERNPNGSVGNVAAIQGYQGRLLAMMPHPERAVRFTQLPDWTRQREDLRRSGKTTPDLGPGAGFFTQG